MVASRIIIVESSSSIVQFSLVAQKKGCLDSMEQWNGIVEWWNELIFNEGNDGQRMKLYFYLLGI